MFNSKEILVPNEIFKIAESLAKQKHKSVGKFVSDLIVHRVFNETESLSRTLMKECGCYIRKENRK